MQSTRYFDLRANVLAHIEGDETHFVVCIHRDDVHAVLVNHQGSGGNVERFLRVGNDKF
jgi:hypothetical protein